MRLKKKQERDNDIVLMALGFLLLWCSMAYLTLNVWPVNPHWVAFPLLMIVVSLIIIITELFEIK